MAVMTAVRRKDAHTGMADAGEAAYNEAGQADERGDEVPNEETLQAMEDVMLGRNLVGPFYTVEELFEDLDADD